MVRKYLKKAFFIVLVGLIALQVPFVYRRWEIGRLSEMIAASDANRVSRSIPGYKEYKGVIHAHTSLGGHSTAGFDELINAASANRLDFVVMTEHYSDKYDTSALTLNGVFGSTLFIGGTEADANDGGRYLVIPGIGDAFQLAKLDSPSFLREVHSRGLLAINNYPDRNRSNTTDFDGIEAYSLHINGKAVNPFSAIFDVLWSFHGYPELTLATYFRRNNDYLARYDRIASQKHLLLDAGSDAHSNKGYYMFADKEGHHLLGFTLDPYSMVFRLVRTHILSPDSQSLTRESLIDALRKGNTFIGFDVIGDTSGFSFLADSGGERRIMGDEIRLAGKVKLSGSLPVPARVVLLRNGEKVAEFPNASEFEYTTSEGGTYRVEAFRDNLGDPFDKAPWIMSNPIYVR